MKIEDLDHLFREPLTRAAVSMTRCFFAAEDLVQETLLRAMMALRDGKEPVAGKEFRWLLGILRHVWQTERRAAFARRDLVRVLGRRAGAAVATAVRSEKDERREAGVAPNPSPRQAEVRRRRSGPDPEPLQLIAQDLGCSVTTVWRDAVLTGGISDARLTTPRR